MKAVDYFLLMFSIPVFVYGFYIDTFTIFNTDPKVKVGCLICFAIVLWRVYG